MPTTTLDFPLFDADNHLYESPAALTRHLPDRHRGAIEYVEIRGRTKILVRGRVSEYIPNPTGEEHVLFGSDYPHPEGLAEPVSYIDELDGLPDDWMRKIMGGNLARLMGVEDVVRR